MSLRLFISLRCYQNGHQTSCGNGVPALHLSSPELGKVDVVFLIGFLHPSHYYGSLTIYTLRDGSPYQPLPGLIQCIASNKINNLDKNPKKLDALHKIKHPTPVWEVVNTGIATGHLTYFLFMVFNELTVIMNWMLETNFRDKNRGTPSWITETLPAC